MAPKRSFRDDPPSASSSSETEVEVEGEEEESQDEDEEEQQEKQVLSPPPPLSKKNSQTQSSDSETESEPGRETIDRAAKTKSKPSPAKPDGKKGSAEEISNGKASKRVKTESKSETEKKPFFQRIWSESDEMAVMTGLIEFSEMKKCNPVHDSNDLYEFIKKKIKSLITKQQLQSKVQSLKKRFRSYEKRVSKGVELKPQEEAFLQLSRKIWGSSEMTEKREMAGPLIVERKEDFAVSGSHWLLKEIMGLCRNGAVSEDFIRKGMNLVDGKKRAEMDDKWRKLQAKELDIVLEQARLIQEQAALIGQAYKSLGS